MKEAVGKPVRCRTNSKRNQSTSSQVIEKQSHSYKRVEAVDQIRAQGVEEDCSVVEILII
jgi:hypothetical protein